MRIASIPITSTMTAIGRTAVERELLTVDTVENVGAELTVVITSAVEFRGVDVVDEILVV
jgi:hypothetical protein